jgi:hypothetical protein
MQRQDVEKDYGAAGLDQQPVQKRIVFVQSENSLDVETPRGMEPRVRHNRLGRVVRRNRRGRRGYARHEYLSLAGEKRQHITDRAAM